MAENLKDMYKNINRDSFPQFMDISFRNSDSDRQTLFYEKVQWDIGGEKLGLRYGENPDQPAAMYKLINGNLAIGGVETVLQGRYLASDVELLQSGKHPGKINITDVDNGLNILRFFSETPCSVIIKHNNPSGVAKGETLAEAFHKSLMADRIAAFGGAVILNREVDLETAEQVTEGYALTCEPGSCTIDISAIGAVGDAFCNPYFITDLSTMDEDPAEVTYQVSELGNKNNFDLSNEDEDVPTINKNLDESRLMQYIVYCGQRSGTTFGMADQNIANSINSGAGSLEASVPVWGGVADMLQGADIVDHIGYVSGEACVTRNESTGLGNDVFKWNEAKYYQRFIEDQRLAENMGLVEESSVSVELRHYYEKNPIDDSADGIIAHYSGMSKEKVADTFDMLEGIMWIAGYDPSEMYPIHQVEMEVAENNKKVIEQEQVSINELFVTPKTTYFVYRKEYTIG